MKPNINLYNTVNYTPKAIPFGLFVCEINGQVHTITACIRMLHLLYLQLKVYHFIVIDLPFFEPFFVRITCNKLTYEYNSIKYFLKFGIPFKTVKIEIEKWHD